MNMWNVVANTSIHPCTAVWGRARRTNAHALLQTKSKLSRLLHAKYTHYLNVWGNVTLFPNEDLRMQSISPNYKWYNVFYFIIFSTVFFFISCFLSFCGDLSPAQKFIQINLYVEHFESIELVTKLPLIFGNPRRAEKKNKLSGEWWCNNWRYAERMNESVKW